MKRTNQNDCRYCLGPHDVDIHAATMSIHAWLREEIMRKIEPYRPIVYGRKVETIPCEMPRAAGF